MAIKIKNLGTISALFGALAGTWVWLVMFGTYMSATGSIQWTDLAFGLIPSSCAILLAIYIYKKALQTSVIHQLRKRLIFTFVWCAIPSILFLLESFSH